ncbi:MAG: hypothetical protein E6Q25_05675 [Acinetobacter sp.]|jgi:uncharacterized lipoprotein NlpE involved in copper resistance|nr:MAG: hypothetical protein E6Q25_05675 [Acinetobacter sp.]
MLLKKIVIATSIATALTFLGCAKKTEESNTNAADAQAAATEAQAAAEAAATQAEAAVDAAAAVENNAASAAE